MFMYDLDQVVFYLLENKVHSASILSRMCIENKCLEGECTKEQEKFYYAFGKNAIKYSTCHGVFEENVLFDSRESLAYSLLKE
jgi:hypothetical protein